MAHRGVKGQPRAAFSRSEVSLYHSFSWGCFRFRVPTTGKDLPSSLGLFAAVLLFNVLGRFAAGLVFRSKLRFFRRLPALISTTSQRSVRRRTAHAAFSRATIFTESAVAANDQYFAASFGLTRLR